MKPNYSRRDFLGAVGLAAGAYMAGPALLSAIPAPASRVAIGQCAEYNRQVRDVLATMFDQLGGLQSLVRGKTVAIKLNLTGLPNTKLGDMPSKMTHWVHPRGHRLSGLAARPGGSHPHPPPGERAIRHQAPRRVHDRRRMAARDFASAATRVEFENTNFLGSGKSYTRFMVPGGGLMYAGYDLNHSYYDTDVFISLAKLKEHRTAGVTLSMKNCFGITPCTIYSDDAPQDEPAIVPERIPRPHALRAPACRPRAPRSRSPNPRTPAIASRASPPTWRPRAPSISPSSTASTP